MANGVGDAVIWENNLVIARVNGRQFQEGQVVLITRRHAPTIFDLTFEEAHDIMNEAQVIGRAIIKAFDAGGLLLYQNNGKLSGQEVPHFHMHLVPQYEHNSPWGNGPKHISALEEKPFVPNRPVDLSPERLREIAGRIRDAL